MIIEDVFIETPVCIQLAQVRAAAMASPHRTTGKHLL
jgi:hypothetical protein